MIDIILLVTLPVVAIFAFSVCVTALAVFVFAVDKERRS